MLCQQKGAEDAGGAGSDDHGPFGKLFKASLRELIGRRDKEGHVLIPEPPYQSFFRLPAAPQGSGDRIDMVKIRFFSGVQGMLFDLPGKDPARISKAKAFMDPSFKGLFPLSAGDLQLRNSYHKSVLSVMLPAARYPPVMAHWRL